MMDFKEKTGYMDLLLEIRNNMAMKKIVVVGDYYLDKYIYIDGMKNQSVYSGGFAFDVEKAIYAPGAAGTIAKNFANLGMKNIYAVGLSGKDGDGYELREKLKSLHINIDNLIITDEMTTPTYTMVMKRMQGQYKEIGEIAKHSNKPVPMGLQRELKEKLIRLIDSINPDAVIFLDQLDHSSMGVINQDMKKTINYIKKKNPQLTVIVDSRSSIDEITADVIRKCNEKEFCSTYKVQEYEIITKCYELSIGNKEPIIVTLGEKGTLISKDGQHFMVSAFNVLGEQDTRGAGDAFTTGYILAKSCKLDEYSAGMIGNLFASCCVSQVATTGVMNLELIENLFGTGKTRMVG